MRGKETILKNLNIFKQNLGNKVQIGKVIFFGSRASGKPHKDSDIDLIIVSKDFRGKTFRERPVGFYDYWNLDYPVDFLCYTPEEFNKLKKQITIVREAVNNGIEI